MTRWVFLLIRDELNFSGFPLEACGNDGIKKHVGMTERRSNRDGAGKIKQGWRREDRAGGGAGKEQEGMTLGWLGANRATRKDDRNLCFSESLANYATTRFRPSVPRIGDRESCACRLLHMSFEHSGCSAQHIA